MTDKPHYILGVDVETRTAKKLARRLDALKSTVLLNGPHLYHADPGYSAIRIVTTKTERELEDWLYTTNHGADYVGVFDAASPAKPNPQLGTSLETR